MKKTSAQSYTGTDYGWYATVTSPIKFFYKNIKYVLINGKINFPGWIISKEKSK